MKHENQKLISFMAENGLTVDDVAEITERKRATVFSWRSNRTPPTWVLPILLAKIKDG
jgi:DNA-binding XRE family transcriptional regulator